MSLDYITINFKNGGRKIKYGHKYIVEGIVDNSGVLITSYDSYYNNDNFTDYITKRVDRLRKLIFNGDAELVLKYDDERKYLAYIPVSFFLTPSEYCKLTGIDCKGFELVEHLYNNIMNVSSKFMMNKHEFWRDLGRIDDDYRDRARISSIFISLLNYYFRGGLINHVYRVKKSWVLIPSNIPFTFSLKFDIKKDMIEQLFSTYRMIFKPIRGMSFSMVDKTVGGFIIKLNVSGDEIVIILKHYYGEEKYKEKW